MAGSETRAHFMSRFWRGNIIFIFINRYLEIFTDSYKKEFLLIQEILFCVFIKIYY